MELLGFSLRCINPGLLSVVTAQHVVVIAASCPWASVDESWLKRMVLVCKQMWVKSWLCGSRWCLAHKACLVRSHLVSSMTLWVLPHYFYAEKWWLQVSLRMFPSPCGWLCAEVPSLADMCICMHMCIHRHIGVSVFPGLQKSWTCVCWCMGPVTFLLQFHRWTGTCFPIICLWRPSLFQGSSVVMVRVQHLWI